MTESHEFLSAYKDVFVESQIRHPDKNENVYSVTLVEDDRSAKLKKVSIYNVPKDSVLLSLRSINLGNALKNILRNDLDVFKCCDYLLVSAIDTGINMVFIEMKSKTFDSGEVENQLKGAACFNQYILAVMKHFYDKSYLDSIKSHRMLIYGRGFSKRSTGSTRKSYLLSLKLPRCNVGNVENADIPYDKLLQ